MVLRYSLAWIPMVFIAIVNGAFRQLVLEKALTGLQAHQVSCLTGVLLFYGYTRILDRKWPLDSARQALAVGIIWLSLTVAFEFLFGYYVVHKPWAELFHDYDILSGRLWVGVLLAVVLLPVIVFKTRSYDHSRQAQQAGLKS